MGLDWDLLAPRPRGLVAPVRVDPAGRTGPTKAQAAGPAWRRVSPSLYVPAAVAGGVEQRILEVSARLSSAGMVGGWAALRLHGAGFFDGLRRDGRTSLPVLLLVGDQRLRTGPLVEQARDRVPPEERRLLHGVPCCGVERAVVDQARRSEDAREAVVAVEMAVGAGLTSVGRVRRHLRDRPGTRGSRQVERALGLAVEGSRSPPETRLRLIWELDAGWERPIVNPRVLDADGRFLGMPDLLDPERGLVAEFDGAHHRSRDRHRRDVGREDRFRRVGLEVVTFVGGDLDDVDLIVDRLHQARRRTSRRPTATRAWRLASAPQPMDAVLDRRDAARH